MQNAHHRRVIDLGGEWEFQTAQPHDDPLELSGPWGKMPVPSNWHLTGLANYTGVVVFRHAFSAPPPEGDQVVYLVFHGVDYYADVWLNGSYLGHHEGYFQPFHFRLGEELGQSNVLIVRVDCPKEEPGKEWPNRKQLIKGVFSHHDCRPGGWNLEHGQEGPTGGIWNRVELMYVPQAHVLWLRLHPASVSERESLVVAQASVHSPKRQYAEVDLTIWPLSDRQQVLSQGQKLFLQPGENRLHLLLPVSSPRLWWTWDHGLSELYVARLVLRTEDGSYDHLEERFGIRELRITEDGEWRLNGRPIFVRGTNIIPTQWLGHYRPEDIVRDVQLLREANVNAVRVHAHVNRPELYDALDGAGILVWQDFAMIWGYEDSPDVARRATAQIKDMVHLLYNHPSVVVWCCLNEPFPQNRRVLGPILADAVSREDPSRHVEEVSDFNSHPYPGWYYGSYREFSGLPGAPMPTEFGAQALPCLETMTEMMPREDLWPPNWERWAYHNFQYLETFHIAHLPMPHSLDEFIAESQDYQAQLLKFAIQHYRLNKGKIKGLFQFMFMDPWPAITWSVVDYRRKPKKGYHVLAQCYQPVLPIIALEREIASPGRLLIFRVAVVNDLPQEFPDAQVKVWVTDPKGQETVLDTFRLTLPADSVVAAHRPPFPKGTCMWRIPWEAEPGSYSIHVEVSDSQGRGLGRNWQELKVVALPLPRSWHPIF